MKLRLGEWMRQPVDCSDWSSERYHRRYHVRRAWGLQFGSVFLGVVTTDNTLHADIKKVRTAWPERVAGANEWKVRPGDWAT